MKRKKIMLALLFIGASLLLIGVGVVVYADQVPINPDPEGTVVDRSELYLLDSYKSYMTDKSWMPFTKEGGSQILNTVVNVLFSLNAVIYKTIASGITLFSDNNVINDHVATFSAYSKAFWDMMWGKFGATIVIVIALYIFYLFLFKSRQRGLNQLLVSCTILMLAFAWTTRSNDLMRGFNNMTNDLQSQMVDATNNTQGTTSGNAVMKVRNIYFGLAIEEPYYLMNYGTANRLEIATAEEPQLADSLLAKKIEDLDSSKLEKEVERQAEDNQYLTSDMIGWKFTIALFAPIMSLVIGVPFLVIQFLSFLFEMFTLILSAFLGLALFVSLIPKFHGVVLNVFKRLLGLFGFRIVLSVMFTLLVSVVTVVRSFVPTDGVANYILQVVLIGVIIFIIWRYRDQILSIATGGKLLSADGGLSSKIFGKLNENRKRNIEEGNDRPNVSAERDQLATSGVDDPMVHYGEIYDREPTGFAFANYAEIAGNNEEGLYARKDVTDSYTEMNEADERDVDVSESEIPETDDLEMSDIELEVDAENLEVDGMEAEQVMPEIPETDDLKMSDIELGIDTEGLEIDGMEAEQVMPEISETDDLKMSDIELDVDTEGLEIDGMEVEQVMPEIPEIPETNEPKMPDIELGIDTEGLEADVTGAEQVMPEMNEPKMLDIELDIDTEGLEAEQVMPEMNESKMPDVELGIDTKGLEVDGMKVEQESVAIENTSVSKDFGESRVNMKMDTESLEIGMDRLKESFGQRNSDSSFLVENKIEVDAKSSELPQVEQNQMSNIKVEEQKKFYQTNQVENRNNLTNKSEWYQQTENKFNSVDKNEFKQFVETKGSDGSVDFQSEMIDSFEPVEKQISDEDRLKFQERLERLRG